MSSPLGQGLPVGAPLTQEGGGWGRWLSLRGRPRVPGEAEAASLGWPSLGCPGVWEDS